MGDGFTRTLGSYEPRSSGSESFYPPTVLANMRSLQSHPQFDQGWLDEFLTPAAVMRQVEFGVAFVTDDVWTVDAVMEM